MINYFVTYKHRNTVRAFLQTWPNEARTLFRVVSYESLGLIRSIRPGVFIFSDLDRLQPEQVRTVDRLCDLIAEHMDASLVVNHPRTMLRRFDLLQAMWSEGVNQFRAHRADAGAKVIRFPAFLRYANDHIGPLTGLLHNAAEYEHERARLASTGAGMSDVIAIEFCDTRGADGLYRKYSAFRIGDLIIPGHVLFCTDWVAKNSPPEPLREEERNYMLHNPHCDELSSIFDRAGIEYGRIDYGLLDGRIQVWEINTNPILIQRREKYSAEKLPLKQQLVDALSDSFLSLHRRAESVHPRRVAVPRSLFDANVTRWARLLSGFEI